LHIETAQLSLEIDEQTGTVASLSAKRDPSFELGGTPENTRYPSWDAGAPWLGDVLLRVWDGSDWKCERTLDSQPRVTLANGAIRIAHPGIESLEVVQTWAADGDALVWTINLTNRSAQALEIGEFAAAFVFNTDYESIFRGEEDKARRAGGDLQRRWHEERLQQHLHIGGSSSYALYQRPSGAGPVLFVGPLGASGWEAAYQIDPEIADQWSNTFEAPYYVATHSRAARIAGRWLQNRQRQDLWMHGNSSLVLAPGERHQLMLQLAILDDLADVRKQLVANGQLAIEAIPGPAAPVGETVRLLVEGGHAVQVRAETGNAIAVEGAPLTDGTRCYDVTLTEPGEKSFLFTYGEGRWTRIFLYATPWPREALRARAKFIVERQVFRNPTDPFGRNQALMPYDNDRECIYLNSEEAWQTGASDEYGVVIGMYLAEKNVHMPDPGEIAAVDDYIDNFVLKRLQDPATLAVRRGMYFWPERPSGIGHEWSEAQASDTTRYNNYPLVANVYYSMFRIAEVYGLGRRAPAEYLSLCWRTLVKGFEVGITKLAGAPAGAFQFEVLEDLRTRDAQGYEALGPWLKLYADHVRADAYPYGSELYIDQTAHAQVFAAVLRDGTDAEIDKTLRITRAMRAGYQPSWFRYGNDERGSVCCWYGTPQNSAVLQRGFELRGNLDFLALAAGGLRSFLTTLRATGAATGWFTWWPDRTGFDPRSLDTDLGLYNYLRAAKAYVVEHPRAGLVGYGCAVEQDAEGVLIRPWDGVGKRLWLDTAGLEVTVTEGAVEWARISASGSVTLRVLPAAADRARIALFVGDLRGQELSVTADGKSLALGTATPTVELTNSNGATVQVRR
jgi:hypothetical protein